MSTLLAIVSLFIFFITSVCYADAELQNFTPRIVLLISINPEQEENSFISVDFVERKERQWDELFRRRFQAFPFHIEVIHRATQMDLWKTLQEPDLVGLFWLSHASSTDLMPGVRLGTQIIDVNRVDVSPLFADLPSNLRYLSIIGCNAQPIINIYREKGYYRHHSMLRIDASNGSVGAESGLVSSSTAAYLYFAYLLKNNVFDSLGADKYEHNTQLRVTRRPLTEEAVLNEARLAHGDRVLAVFPFSDKTDEQVAYIDLREPLDEDKYRFLTFTLGRGLNPGEAPNLGELRIELLNQRSGYWELVKKPDGAPLGVSHHLYRYAHTVP